LLIEIGNGQAQKLEQTVESIPNLVLRGFRTDLQGISRTAIIERSSPS